jgi:hypothetical protein
VSETVKQRKKEMREDERKRREELRERVEKGRSRPCLFEQSSVDLKKQSNLAFLKATQKMLDVLKANGEKNPEKYVPAKYFELKEEEELKEKLKKDFKATI